MDACSLRGPRTLLLCGQWACPYVPSSSCDGLHAAGRLPLPALPAWSHMRHVCTSSILGCRNPHAACLPAHRVTPLPIGSTAVQKCMYNLGEPVFLPAGGQPVAGACGHGWAGGGRRGRRGADAGGLRGERGDGHAGVGGKRRAGVSLRGQCMRRTAPSRGSWVAIHVGGPRAFQPGTAAVRSHLLLAAGQRGVALCG